MTPLQDLMRVQGRRQDWLAEQIGKHPSEVSRIVGGFVPRSKVTRQAIADALGCKVEELWPS